MGRASKWIVAGIVVAGLAAWAAAHWRLVPARFNPLEPLDLAEPPGMMTDVKLWIMGNDPQACMAALQRAGVKVKAMPVREDRPGCRRSGTVSLSALSQAEIGEEEMRCDMALRLYLHERHDLQPLARRHFGSPVSRIIHFGSYSCRTIRGSSRMSQHATANAFDIAGFRLKDGRTISLKRDWTAGNASARFLHEARDRACTLFNVVLSPDYNADHADHFHVDMGFFRSCR